MPTLTQLEAQIAELRTRLDSEADKWVGKALASPWTWVLLPAYTAAALAIGFVLGRAGC